MVLRRSSSHQQMALSHCIASWRQIGKFLCKYILVFRRLCAFINNDLNGAQTSLSCEKSIAVCYACWLYMLYVVQVKSAILLLTLSYHINLEWHSIAFLCWCAIKKLLPHSLTVTNTWYQWWCDNCSHCQCHYILWRLLHNHTLARYCESVVRATMQVSGETQNLNPTTPNPPYVGCGSHKNLQRWLRHGPMCESSSRSAQGFRFHACVTLHTKLHTKRY